MTTYKVTLSRGAELETTYVGAMTIDRATELALMMYPGWTLVMAEAQFEFES